MSKAEMKAVPQQKDRRKIFHWQLRTYKTKSKSVRMRQTAIKANVSPSSIVFLFLFRSLQSDVRIVAEYESYFYRSFPYVSKNRLRLHSGNAFNYRPTKIQRDSLFSAHMKHKQNKGCSINHILWIWNENPIQIGKIEYALWKRYLNFVNKRAGIKGSLFGSVLQTRNLQNLIFVT